MSETLTSGPMRKPLLLVGCGVVAVIGLCLLILGYLYVSVGNRLVALDEARESQWAQVESVLQRRFDLIPNLVETVRGYADHEREVLSEVTRLRSQWGAAKTVEEKAEAATGLQSALARLLVVAERYPDLKADRGFQNLQYELAGTENRINVERQRYNEAVRNYNTAIRQFPGSLVASMRGFTPSDAYFEADQQARQAPQVDFGPRERTETDTE